MAEISSDYDLQEYYQLEFQKVDPFIEQYCLECRTEGYPINGKISVQIAIK